MKQIRKVLLFFPLLVTGLKADVSFTATFMQPTGSIPDAGSFAVPVTVTNSATSTEDIVYVEEPFLDFDLEFPDGTHSHNRYYMGRVPSTMVDIAPGESLTVLAAFFLPAERFSSGSPTPPNGTTFTLSIPDVRAAFADGTRVDIAPTGTFAATISSNPEPATWVLLGSALVAVIARRKKRAFN